MTERPVTARLGVGAPYDHTLCHRHASQHTLQYSAEREADTKRRREGC
jgi:hypothetical protein